MDNLAPAQLSADEIPDGFTSSSAQSPAGGANNAAAMKKLQMDEQRKAVLEQALSQEALARLGRIKLVKPDKARIVEHQIVSLAMQGKLPGKISEAKLIEFLERGSVQGGAEKIEKIMIQRKKYAFDDDSDDDDNDDDLLWYGFESIFKNTNILCWLWYMKCLGSWTFSKVSFVAIVSTKYSICEWSQSRF